MRVVRTLLVMAGLAFALTNAKAATWLTSLEAAKTQAAGSGRLILIFFTSSDWSPASQSLRSTVLDTPEFRAFADEAVVLLEVDFPRYRQMAALQKQANDQLSRKYGITSYPTLLLAKANGDAVGAVRGAGTPAQMVDTLRQTIARVQGRELQPGNSSAAARTRPPSEPPPLIRDLPLFGGATTQPLPVYTNLSVKTISGPPNRRFAMINNETMMAGDTFWLKLANERVQVRCVEVREKSVLVLIGGEKDQRELPLANITR